MDCNQAGDADVLDATETQGAAGQSQSAGPRQQLRRHPHASQSFDSFRRTPRSPCQTQPGMYILIHFIFLIFI